MITDMTVETVLKAQATGGETQLQTLKRIILERNNLIYGFNRVQELSSLLREIKPDPKKAPSCTKANCRGNVGWHGIDSWKDKDGVMHYSPMLCCGVVGLGEFSHLMQKLNDLMVRSQHQSIGLSAALDEQTKLLLENLDVIMEQNTRLKFHFLRTKIWAWVRWCVEKLSKKKVNMAIDGHGDVHIQKEKTL